MKILNDSNEVIPSALEKLNENTNGGFRKSGISVFSVQPNTGKTTLLCNEASNAYKLGYNVLYLTLEMSEETIYSRIACNILDIPIHDDFNFHCNYSKLNIPNCGNLIIKEINFSKCIPKIEDLILEYYTEHGRSVDMLVIDYIDIIEGKGNIRSEVSREIHRISRKYNIAVVTASQATLSKDINYSIDLSSTSGLAVTVDLVIGTTQTKELKEKKQIDFTILKNRNGIHNVSFIGEYDYEYMRIKSI